MAFNLLGVTVVIHSRLAAVLVTFQREGVK
jgi:hypothetical protein